MNSEHTNTTKWSEIPDDAWDVFLPDGEEEPQPDEGDFWFDVFDDENEESP